MPIRLHAHQLSIDMGLEETFPALLDGQEVRQLAIVYFVHTIENAIQWGCDGNMGLARYPFVESILM